MATRTIFDEKNSWYVLFDVPRKQYECICNTNMDWIETRCLGVVDPDD